MGHRGAGTMDHGPLATTGRDGVPHGAAPMVGRAMVPADLTSGAPPSLWAGLPVGACWWALCGEVGLRGEDGVWWLAPGQGDIRMGEPA